MTRIFNIVMLTLLAGIYYVQNDGFGSAKTTIDSAPAPQTTTAKAIDTVTPVQTASVAVTATTEPMTAVQIEPAAIPTGVMSKDELSKISERFLADRLVASTLVREVDLITTSATPAPPREPVLQVSGSVVNARSAPTTKSNVLARLRRGTEVVGTGETQGSWVEVTILESGETVWMHTKFLSVKS